MALLAVFATASWMRTGATGALTIDTGDALILSALGIGSAAAQSAPRKGFVVNPRTFLDSCPPGHRIQFQSGGMSLYVDPRLLDSISVLDLVKAFEDQCPFESVPVPERFKHAFFFGKAALAAANTPANLGTSYFRLITGFVPRRDDKPLPGASREPVQHPTVFDVPPPLPDSRNSQPPRRIYDLHYPDDGTGSSTTIRVSCNGGGPETNRKRSCFTATSYDTPYRYRGTISIRYTFSQPYSPEAQPSTHPALAERELVLAFDIRVRAWIDSMLTKP